MCFVSLALFPGQDTGFCFCLAVCLTLFTTCHVASVTYHTNSCTIRLCVYPWRSSVPDKRRTLVRLSLHQWLNPLICPQVRRVIQRNCCLCYRSCYSCSFLFVHCIAGCIDSFFLCFSSFPKFDFAFRFVRLFVVFFLGGGTNLFHVFHFVTDYYEKMST